MATSEKINLNCVTIRSIEDEDLEEIDRLWRLDHWDYGIDCLRFITDQEFCVNKGFAAMYDGVIIGTGFAYIMNDELASLGGFFVKPEFRYMGVGQLIWDARMKYLGDRNVVVNAANTRQEKNVRLGFTHCVGEYDLYQGMAKSHDYDAAEFKDDVDSMVSLSEINFDQLISYDNSVVKVLERRKFLETAIQKYSIKGFVALKAGQIVGYISQMPTNDFVTLGSWYAEAPSVGKALFKKFLSILPENSVVMGPIPRTNKHAQELMKENGYKIEGTLKCLFLNNGYDVEWNRIYSIVNQCAWLW